MMKVLLAIPMYGGQLEAGTRESLQRVEMKLREEKIDFAVATLTKESLIPRGRNVLAAEAMKGKFTDLFFIDADLTFTWEMFRSVLFSKYDICGGTYPLKTFPITLNFNAFLEDKEKAQVKGPMNQDNYFKFVRECADSNGEIEVAHVPTGFLRIRTSVFEKFCTGTYSKHIEAYVSTCGVTHQRTTYRDFFKIGVRGQDYLSEDWFFCEHARAEGFPIALQTKAVCGHVGKWEFNLGQFVTVGQTPLIPQGKEQ